MGRRTRPRLWNEDWLGRTYTRWNATNMGNALQATDYRVYIQVFATGPVPVTALIAPIKIPGPSVVITRAKLIWICLRLEFSDQWGFQFPRAPWPMQQFVHRWFPIHLRSWESMTLLICCMALLAELLQSLERSNLDCKISEGGFWDKKILTLTLTRINHCGPGTRLDPKFFTWVWDFVACGIWLRLEGMIQPRVGSRI